MSMAESFAKNVNEPLASSDGECEAGASGRAHASHLSSECAATLHALNNAVSVILLNAQVMEWKLPPYSHVKRHAREIERNAQRSAELLKQLARKSPVVSIEKVFDEQLTEAVTGQEPDTGLAEATIFRESGNTAPALPRARKAISHNGL